MELPRPRGAGAVAAVGGKIHHIGGTESCDPRTDAWLSHAPMPTPRHGLGAALVGGTICVAGGGPVPDFQDRL